MASEKRKKYTIRPSYLYNAKHFNDVILNQGYDYKGKMLKNGTSPEIWANPLQTPMLNTLEGMLTYLLESTKMIKKWFSIAHDKNTTIIN